jgi:hypothetical protein
MFKWKLGNLSDIKNYRVIFGKINSRIQTLTLGNYLFIIQVLETELFNHFWQMTE